MIRPKRLRWDRPPAMRTLTGHMIIPLRKGDVEYIHITEAGFWYGRLPLEDGQVVIGLFTRRIRQRRAFAWYEAYGWDVAQEIPMLEYDRYSTLIEARDAATL